MSTTPKIEIWGTDGNERPDEAVMDELIEQGKEKLMIARPHEPGEGWHFLPGVICLYHNGKYWWASPRSSEGAVLAHVEDICGELGLEPRAIHQAAYSDRPYYPPTDEDRAACARRATPDDIHDVLDDLTDINYHGFRSAFVDALVAAGLAGLNGKQEG